MAHCGIPWQYVKVQITCQKHNLT